MTRNQRLNAENADSNDTFIRTTGLYEPLAGAEVDRLCLIAQRGRRSRSILITRNLRSLLPLRHETNDAQGARALAMAIDRAVAQRLDLGTTPLTDLVAECLREISTEDDESDERVDDIDCIIAEIIPFQRIPELYAHYANLEEPLLLVIAALKGARKAKLTKEQEYALRMKFMDKLRVKRPSEEDVRRVITLAWRSFMPLNRKQVATHARNVREGYAAANTVIRHNGRLAIKFAGMYHIGGLSMKERVVAAQLGIMKAIYRFEPTRGFKFSTYASWWIRHAIRRTQGNEGRTIRIPVHQEDILFRLRKFEYAVATTDKSDKETAHAIGTTVEKLRNLRPHLHQPASFDAPLNADVYGVTTLSDMTPDDGETAEETLRRKQRELLARDLLMQCDLKGIERVILARRFGIGNDDDETLKQIGDSYNLSRERIRQLEADALKKLRRYAREHRLADTV